MTTVTAVSAIIIDRDGPPMLQGDVRCVCALPATSIYNICNIITYLMLLLLLPSCSMFQNGFLETFSWNFSAFVRYVNSVLLMYVYLRLRNILTYLLTYLLTNDHYGSLRPEIHLYSSMSGGYERDPLPHWGWGLLWRGRMTHVLELKSSVCVHFESNLNVAIKTRGLY